MVWKSYKLGYKLKKARGNKKNGITSHLLPRKKEKEKKLKNNNNWKIEREKWLSGSFKKLVDDSDGLDMRDKKKVSGMKERKEWNIKKGN